MMQTRRGGLGGEEERETRLEREGGWEVGGLKCGASRCGLDGVGTVCPDGHGAIRTPCFKASFSLCLSCTDFTGHCPSHCIRLPGIPGRSRLLFPFCRWHCGCAES